MAEHEVVGELTVQCLEAAWNSPSGARAMSCGQATSNALQGESRIRSGRSRTRLSWSPCCCTAHRTVHDRAGAAAVTSTLDAIVCTIGHSNRPIEDFIGLFWANEVAQVIDVRTMPRSRHNPQFNLDSLPATLAAVGIDYSYMPGLGDLRHARADSPNTGWHNASFRGYPDYMQSADFAENVDRVVALASAQRCALMCAEAVPWRCHRSMIADALLVRGVSVGDVIGPRGRKQHALTSFARIDGLQLTYPPPAVGDDDSAASPAGQRIAPAYTYGGSSP